MLKFIPALLLTTLFIPSCSMGATTMPGDILINGDGCEPVAEGTIITYTGYVQLANDQLSSEHPRIIIFVITPKANPILGNGGGIDGFEGDNSWLCPASTELDAQLKPADETHYKTLKLSYKFDGRHKRASILGHDFDWAKGKLFVIKYDAQWKPTVSQVGNNLQTKLVPARVLKEIKRRFGVFKKH